MSSDDLLKSAIAHWGARFVANGVNLSDFEDVTASLKSYDDWCAAWSKRAALHEVTQAVFGVELERIESCFAH